MAWVGGVHALSPTRVAGHAVRTYSGRPKQHPVQNIGGDGYLGRLSPLRLRAQPAANDAFPARDIGLPQSTPAVSRRPLPAHAAALGDTSQMPVALRRRGPGRLA